MPLPKNVPRGEKGDWTFPRRNCVDQLTPAELAIRDAMIAVEAAGGHILLTEAITLLSQAKDKVADYLEETDR